MRRGYRAHTGKDAGQTTTTKPTHMPAYTRTEALDGQIAHLLESKEYHESLRKSGFRIDVLSFQEEGKSLRFRGSDVFGFVKINTKRDRALGLGDATLIFDQERYNELTPAQRLAFIDHELYHLFVKDDNDGQQKYDDHGRPVLGIRPHDFEFGWFRRIAAEHKDAALEVIQARELIAKHGKILLHTQEEFSFVKAMPTEAATADEATLNRLAAEAERFQPLSRETAEEHLGTGLGENAPANVVPMTSGDRLTDIAMAEAGKPFSQDDAVPSAEEVPTGSQTAAAAKSPRRRRK